MAEIFENLKNHKPLKKDLVNEYEVIGDGNCYYRVLSLYFTNDESYFNFFREQIYFSAKDNINLLKEFFINDKNDEILCDNKLKGYINKIKDNKFFAGNIEIYLTTKIFDINIALYKYDSSINEFTQISFFGTESSSKEYLIINYVNNSHYNLLKLKLNSNKKMNYQNNTKEIQEKKFNNNNINTNLSPRIYSKDIDYKLKNVLINVGENINYYDDVFNYLISLEKSKYTTKNNEVHIHWSNLQYPKDLCNNNLSQKAIDKKKYNYRKKAKNYILESNLIFFTGYAGKNNCRLRVPFYNEKYNILANAHINNGHIGINRTVDKIKEAGFFWETMLDDVKEYIGNCSKCILSKKGKNINQKVKKIIPLGPLDRVVIDGWALDEDIKSLTGYSHIIDIIDHFSKYLLSIPVKNNNAQNILYCLKQFFQFVGVPKIIQSDNGTEYNNSIINNFLTTHEVKHITLYLINKSE